MAKKWTGRPTARGVYKAMLLDFIADVGEFDCEGDIGLQFWRKAVQVEANRQIGKLASDTPAQRAPRERAPADDKAIEQLRRENKALREVIRGMESATRSSRRDLRLAGDEGWERLQIAQRELADLRRQFGLDPDPSDDPAVDDDGVPFWTDDSAPASTVQA